jgi:hypothetical protein
LLAAFAPQRRIPVRGRLLSAGLSGIYLGRERRTHFRFDSPDGRRLHASYDHDRGLVSTASEGDLTENLEELGRVNPWPLEVRLLKTPQNVELSLFDKRPNWPQARKLRALIEYPAGTDVRLGRIVNWHPDLVLLWSAADQIYFTNRDFLRIYRFPDRPTESWTRPELVRPMQN